MAQYELSVAAALNKIKVINARIADLSSAQFVNFSVNGRVGDMSEADFVKQAQANYQRALQLLHNRTVLKAAIAESNARTEIAVGRARMTVAAAIEHKSGIEFTEQLWRTMSTQLANSKRSVEAQNRQLAAQAEQEATRFYANVTEKDESAYRRFVQEFIAQRAAKVVAGEKMEELVNKIGAEIQDFRANVDLALTTSNVQTMISVDFDPAE